MLSRLRVAATVAARSAASPTVAAAVAAAPVRALSSRSALRAHTSASHVPTHERGGFSFATAPGQSNGQSTSRDQQRIAQREYRDACSCQTYSERAHEQQRRSRLAVSRLCSDSLCAASGNVNLPPARNEPMLSYAPGSAERAKLEAALAKLKAAKPLTIPAIIGDREVLLNTPVMRVTSPTNHKHGQSTQPATRSAFKSQEQRSWSHLHAVFSLSALQSSLSSARRIDRRLRPPSPTVWPRRMSGRLCPSPQRPPSF